MVNLPTFAIMLLGFVSAGYLEALFAKGWIFPLGFIGTFVLMWLWWSLMITRWRIWAFEHCRNVHELKQRAISAGLIWRDGSWFEKTEIRSRKQQQKLSLLEDKFQKDDQVEVIEDTSLSNETRIYHSKLALGILWMGGIGLLGYGIYTILDGDVLGYLFAIAACYMLYLGYKKSKIKEPHLILNESGIKTLNTDFISWEEVTFIETSCHGSRWYLSIRIKKAYTNSEHWEEMELSDLNMAPKKIAALIRGYQQRYKNNL